MKHYLKILLLAVAALCGTVCAQDSSAVYSYPKLDGQITDETDARYYFLMDDVFPDFKASSSNPYKNSASRSIRLRKLFGEGYSELNERREIGIADVRWLRGANNRKYLVVLFTANPPDEQFDPDAETFYALAVFSYVRRKVAERNVYNSLHYKWVYEFDLIDAVDPQSDYGVELPDALPEIKNELGAETFWLLNSHTNGGSVRNYAAIELRDNRLNPFFEGFPTLYDFDCARRFEQNFEIVPLEKPVGNAPPFELRVVSRIWLANDCQARETLPDLREIETYRAGWQTISKRRVVSFKPAGKRVERIDNAEAHSPTGAAECDDYLKKYEICFRTKLYPAAATRPDLETYVGTLRESFKKAMLAVKSPQERGSLCVQVKKAASEQTAVFGCEW